MWLTVRLLIWGLLSSSAAGSGDEILVPQSSDRGWCHAILTSEKLCPAQTDLWSRQTECRSWRPIVAAKSAVPTTPHSHCVFSHPSFRDGHGLSIVTTSEVMSELLTHGVLDEREEHGPCSLSSPSDFMPGPVVDPGTGIPAYEVRRLPGRGKGAIALRLIKRNETLLLDYPTILAAWNVIGQSLDESHESLFGSAVNHLPAEARQRALGLSRAGLVPNLPLCDLLKTNVCGLVVGNGIPHVGLFSEFAVSLLD